LLCNRGVQILNDWFSWNGVRCTEYGIHVSEQPHMTIPAERATFTNVPGRSGSLTTLEGDDVYDDLILTATCFVQDVNRIPEIAAWLKGGGKVTFANRPGGFYHARIVNQISFEKILRGNPHRSFAVNFRCKPFWYAENVEPITLTVSGGTITNPGNVPSEPVITVYGSGEITLMVGLTVVELEGISGSITLDSPLMEAYSGTISMNDNMNGDFPTLAPGMNAVSWSGGVTKIEVRPNWRDLI
jgi:phage-related protein